MTLLRQFENLGLFFIDDKVAACFDFEIATVAFVADQAFITIVQLGDRAGDPVPDDAQEDSGHIFVESRRHDDWRVEYPLLIDEGAVLHDEL